MKKTAYWPTCLGCSALFAALVLGVGEASADPYRLSAQAYAFPGVPTTPGLVVLSGQAVPSAWADAEALVWMGAGIWGSGARGDTVGNVVVANVRLREPHGYADLRLGRMQVSMGAVRPLLLDGAMGAARVPGGPTLRVFGGVPVEVPVNNVDENGEPVNAVFAAKPFDWVAGGHFAQPLSRYGSVGFSYFQRRNEGNLAFEELGFDASIAPVKWLDFATVIGIDMPRRDVASFRASAAFEWQRIRAEAFAIRRSPARMLPATSLFAALGDVPSDAAGLTLWARVAPRLDVWTVGSAESIAGLPAGRVSIHSTLRLDDLGKSAVGVEARRQWIPGQGGPALSSGDAPQPAPTLGPDQGWTGARGTMRLALLPNVHVSAEIEVVVPDNPNPAASGVDPALAPRSRGSVWPWGLFSVTVIPAPWIDLAGAVEAGASPTRAAWLSGILRAGLRWDAHHSERVSGANKGGSR